MKAAGHNNSPMQKNFPKDISANPGDTPLEKFDWSAAAAGGAKGAATGATIGGPWGAAIGGVGMGIMAGIQGGKAQEAEAAAMDEAEKNRIVAEKLKKDKKRESLGYSGFEEESA